MRNSIRYLIASKDLGLTYYKGTEHPNQLVGFCDGDFAGCTVTRKSTWFYVVFMNGGPIIWKSKLAEGKPAGSTLENEIVAVYHLCQEILYLRMLLKEMGFPQTEPTTIYCDNDAAIILTSTGRMTQRNKHIDIKYCILKSLIVDGTIAISYVKTKCNIADIGTKAIKDYKQFHLLRDSMLHLPA